MDRHETDFNGDGTSIPPSENAQAHDDSDPGPVGRLWFSIVAPRRASAGLGRRRFEWVVPVIVMAVLGTVASLLLSDLTLEATKDKLQAMVERGYLTEELYEKQIDSVRARTEATPARAAVNFAMALGGSALLVLVVGAVFHASTRFVAEARQTYWQSVSAYAYGLLPIQLGTVITVPVQLAKGSLAVQFSLAALIGGESLLAQMLGIFGIFSVWSAALMVYNFSRVGMVSIGRAAAAVLGVWGIYWLLRIFLLLTPLREFVTVT